MRNHRIPLLKDRHSHPLMYAALRGCIDLGTVADKEDALSRIKNDGEGIAVVIGWNDGWYEFTRKELDALPPCIVFNASFHSHVMNAPARERLDGDVLFQRLRQTGRVQKSPSVLMKFILHLKPVSPAQLSEFYESLSCRGVWYAEEMLLAGEEELDLFQRASLMDRAGFWSDFSTYLELSPPAREMVHGVKIHTDGSLGSKTAKLNHPYATGGTGFLVYSDGELLSRMEKIAEMGGAMALHAIGDDAIDQVIRMAGELRRAHGPAPEIRVEHAQFISRQAAREAKRLGIVLCMQPNFSVDSEGYGDRLPAGYPERNNPFRMLIDEAGFVPGRDLIFGSDGMPHGVPDAVAMALHPPFPGQRLTIHEFVAGYCLPDTTNGHIDIEVDEENESVSTTVIME